MPTAISWPAVDPSSSGCRAEESTVSSRGGWCWARLHSDRPGEVLKVGQEKGVFRQRVLEGIYSITCGTTGTVCFNESTSVHSAGVCDKDECKRRCCKQKHQWHIINFAIWRHGWSQYDHILVFLFRGPFETMNTYMWCVHPVTTSQGEEYVFFFELCQLSDSWWMRPNLAPPTDLWSFAACSVRSDECGC